MDSENSTIEDQEEISETDQRAASIAAKRDTLPRTAKNVIYYMIQRENLDNSATETMTEEEIEEETEVTREEADLEVVIDTRSTEEEVQVAQAEAEV